MPDHDMVVQFNLESRGPYLQFARRQVHAPAARPGAQPTNLMGYWRLDQVRD
ncbi:hypothetical protein [Reyranella soli]|nr:hypothetical protein [Reyranella soli]